LFWVELIILLDFDEIPKN